MDLINQITVITPSNERWGDGEKGERENVEDRLREESKKRDVTPECSLLTAEQQKDIQCAHIHTLQLSAAHLQLSSSFEMMQAHAAASLAPVEGM